MQRSECSKLVALLAAAYRDAAISDTTADVYETLLADLSYQSGQAAIHRLICTSKWLPTVAEIRQTAADIERGPVRRGAEAYADVIAEIRRTGQYGVPRFTDPIVTECVTLMTWRGLCLGDNEAADRARFIELYDSLAARQRVDIVAGRQLPSGPRGLALPPVAARQLASPVRVSMRDINQRPVELAQHLREGRPTLPAPPVLRMSAEELDAALDKRAGGAR
jgi:hypothetical protein